MKIERLYINNFKTLVDFELVNPSAFLVFVGPNAAGKSNIFEALEFITLSKHYLSNTHLALFGGKESILNINLENNTFDFKVAFDNGYESFIKNDFNVSSTYGNQFDGVIAESNPLYQQTLSQHRHFFEGYCRIFPSGRLQPKLNFTDDSKLSINASNLEKVLRRILSDHTIKDEFIEWLQLFIPEFDKIEVVTDEIDGETKMRIFEKYTNRPLNKALISDGTFNILAILCAVFQTNEPQFLCIEEPENGLNPKVIKSLVGFFRDKCLEKGHFIWLNTHSQTLVSQLHEDEIIVVDKLKGVTKVQQYKNLELKGMSLDEAWLTNILGGGLPW